MYGYGKKKFGKKCGKKKYGKKNTLSGAKMQSGVKPMSIFSESDLKLIAIETRNPSIMGSKMASSVKRKIDR